MTAAMVAGIQSICHFGKMQIPYLGELEFLFRRALGPNYRLARVTLTSESPSVDVCRVVGEVKSRVHVSCKTKDTRLYVGLTHLRRLLITWRLPRNKLSVRSGKDLKTELCCLLP